MNGPIAWFNGRFLPLDEVKISPLDRGFLFADGIYEVVPAYSGRMLWADEHIERLLRSLHALNLDPGLDVEAWQTLMQTLIERNGGGDRAVYLQVTRGAPTKREHRFPSQEVPPTLFGYTWALAPRPAELKGQQLYLVDDPRWQRCDIKSISLLANVLALGEAHAAGYDDILMHREGLLTEGSAANVFIVRDGIVHTPPLSSHILPGITRLLVLQLARDAGIECREQPLPSAWLDEADELWLCSSTREMVPVTQVNGRPIAQGEIGPVFRQLDTAYQAMKQRLIGNDAA